jgi:hypothetical protein
MEVGQRSLVERADFIAGKVNTAWLGKVANIGGDQK